MRSRSARCFLRARRDPAQPVARQRTDQRPGDDAGAAVTQTIEVVHRFRGGLRVVDVHAGHAKPRIELATVDDRRAPREHRAHQRRGLLRQTVAEKDQAVRLFPPQHRRVAVLARLVVLRVAEQHGVALALRGVFDAAEDQREKRVGDVGHRDEQLAGLERAQVLGRGVRRIAEDDRRRSSPFRRVAGDTTCG
jgi:hypothetical protein